MLKEKVIAFLGTGNIAEALIKGVLQARLLPPGNILISDVRADRLEALRKEYQIRPFPGNIQAAQKADIVIIAVKPQVIHKVLDELAGIMDESKLILSVAAGIPLTLLTSSLCQGGCKNPRIIRIMPNTPALVQEGAAALTKGEHASEDDMVLARDLFNAVGKTVIVKEPLMDAVTGLSGSGPAYVCAMLEALSEGGVKMGLPEDIAQELSLQTILGTARMIRETGRRPSELREMVTSPGGTTVEGLRALDDGEFRKTVIKAIEAATNRAKELGKNIKPD